VQGVQAHVNTKSCLPNV